MKLEKDFILTLLIIRMVRSETRAMAQPREAIVSDAA